MVFVRFLGEAQIWEEKCPQAPVPAWHVEDTHLFQLILC